MKVGRTVSVLICTRTDIDQEALGNINTLAHNSTFEKELYKLGNIFCFIDNV